jgi:3-dehydroquinate synthase
MEAQPIVFSHDIALAVEKATGHIRPDATLLLCDDTTARLCKPLLGEMGEWLPLITIRPSDTHKTLDSLTHVWQELQRLGATRHSLLLNLGGGMVTDLGGFAASTFKRGLHFVNIPTTLLAMVDASVGGKTGINFGGLKNELGTFRNADEVIVDTRFLQTLDTQNMLSGYAEMLKHALIDSPEMLSQVFRFDILHPDLTQLQQMVCQSVAVKQRIVLEDPLEQGLRKALNLGHTAGHAFESWSMDASTTALPHPLLHGYAVAYGLVVELYLSVTKAGLPVSILRQVTTYVREYYGQAPITCNDYPRLLQLMHHDKKNTGRDIVFTLLSDIGQPIVNQTASEDEILEALDFYREG